MEQEPDINRDMRYFTKRFLYGRRDPKKKVLAPAEHYAVLWVYKDAPEELYINYYCPNCNHKGFKKGVFDGVSEIMFTCDSCEKTINIPKLRGKRKKKKKKNM